MTAARIPLARIRAAWIDPRMSQAEAAASIGVARRTLRKWAHMLELPPRTNRPKGARPAEIDQAELTRLWQRGDRIVDIAAHFKRTPATISTAAKRIGLPPRKGAI
jgi:transposase